MKINALTFLLFFATINILCAQDSSDKKWQAAVFFTPKIDYRFLQSVGEDERSLLIVEGKNEMDKVRVGLVVGLACFYNINDRMRFKIGFEYTNTGYQQARFSINEPDTTTGNPSSPITFTNGYLLTKLTFYKTPIAFRYTLSNEKKKIWPFIEANVKPSFSSFFFNNPDLNFTISSTLGVSLPKVFHDETYFGLTFDYFLKGFPTPEYTDHHYSIGLEIGYIFW